MDDDLAELRTWLTTQTFDRPNPNEDFWLTGDDMSSDTSQPTRARITHVWGDGAPGAEWVQDIDPDLFGRWKRHGKAFTRHADGTVSVRHPDLPYTAVYEVLRESSNGGAS